MIADFNRVLLPDGNTKVLSNLSVGDKLWVYDTDRDLFEEARVLALRYSSKKVNNLVCLDNLVVTSDHLIYDKDPNIFQRSKFINRILTKDNTVKRDIRFKKYDDNYYNAVIIILDKPNCLVVEDYVIYPM